MKITTKTGDGGETGLFGGRRVSKGDGIVDLLGEIDEFMAFLGWCKIGVRGGEETACEGECAKRGEERTKRAEKICAILDRIQVDLSGIMSFVGSDSADGGEDWPENAKRVGEEDVGFLESAIKEFEDDFGDGFVRPGVTEEESRFHIARCVCRRVERRMVAFGESGDEPGKAELGKKVPDMFVKYLNRLSDLLFVLARNFEDFEKK